ncbi:MAG: futalosine hydrolase [Bacteroidales bacterium]|nr:futalosine hydrolase [Bacteroidales bacterium]
MTRILISLATDIEIHTEYKNRLNQLFPNLFDVLITGMGNANTIYYLTKTLQQKKYDLVINMGICGAFNEQLNVGQVVQVIADTFGDLGFQEEHTFIHLAELEKKTIFLEHKNEWNLKIPKVCGITVNTVSSDISRNKMMQQKYNADIETMESAAYFMVCKYENIPLIALRAVSNRVGERDKSKWNIALAVHNLWLTLLEIFSTFNK